MKIVRYPHPALRHQAQPVASIDKQIHLYVGEMFELMREAKGIGLAANQVALPYRLLVLNVATETEQASGEQAFLNPVIVERKGTVEEEEGCLSLPGLYQKIRRARSVKVHAYNLKGEAVEIVANELAARAWQHEVDHLNGVLFIDKMGPIAKLASRGALRDFERDYERAQERGELPGDEELKKQLLDRELVL